MIDSLIHASCDHPRLHRTGARTWTAGLIAVAIGALVFLSGPAAQAAGWKSRTIATHTTSIYTPDSTLPGSDRRGLMVLLHGCAQPASQLKNGLNLEQIGNQFGLVIAVPQVSDGYLKECWDYDGSADNHGHLAEITALAKELSNDSTIDSRHVYVVGLSSGGALALKLGCKAPDLFAGIGAIAGPSVGSSQWQALNDLSGTSESTIKTAVDTCRALAGDKTRFFNSQVANIAYGDMDRNGPKAINDGCQQTHPGQNCVASIWWNLDSIEALRRIYGAGELGPETAVQDGQATQRNAQVGDQTALALLVMNNVGHAFAAGSGRPNTADNGQYIAQQGVNHLQYAANWLISNNRRTGTLVQCQEPKVTGNAVELQCTASPKPIDSIHVMIAGPSPVDDTVPGEKLSKQYPGLANGNYQAVVTAKPQQGNTSPKVTIPFRVPSAGPTQCMTAENQQHSAAGRAEPCYWFYYCAKGSGDYLGFFATTKTSLEAQTGQSGAWKKVDQCTGFLGTGS